MNVKEEMASLLPQAGNLLGLVIKISISLKFVFSKNIIMVFGEKSRNNSLGGPG